jgi:hypothetical protein
MLAIRGYTICAFSSIPVLAFK